MSKPFVDDIAQDALLTLYNQLYTVLKTIRSTNFSL